MKSFLIISMQHPIEQVSKTETDSKGLAVRHLYCKAALVDCSQFCKLLSTDLINMYSILVYGLPHQSTRFKIKVYLGVVLEWCHMAQHYALLKPNRVSKIKQKPSQKYVQLKVGNWVCY